MADQCIVCLENLDVESSVAVAAAAALVAGAPLGHLGQHHDAAENNDSDSSSVPPQNLEAADAAPSLEPTTLIITDAVVAGLTSPRHHHHHENHDHVAKIDVCGHVLHNNCLREWSEKANSCPICRQTFNLVHVYDKVGGKLLSSREVEDKKQVAEFDLQIWLDENPDEEEIQIPCPICNLADQEDVLLLCDACDTPYHTHCIGLDSVPRGSWYCMECVTVLGTEDPAPSPSAGRTLQSPSRSHYAPRTQATLRRARRRARSDEWQGAWGRIAGRIWDAINLDLDYQDDEDPVVFEGFRRSQQIREQERIEHERWQQRLNIASRMGARDVFARNIPNVMSRMAPRPQTPPQEPQEAPEVLMAWGALEKARELETRKRKERSMSAEPSEPQHEPERKLKRPRTRRLPTHSGESASAPVNAGPSPHQADQPNPAPNPAAPNPTAPGTDGVAPSFLSSLLKEVEMSAPSNGTTVEEIYGRIPGANDVVSSPIHSPSRASSSTPPPNQAARPSSPVMTLSSMIAPIYPPANYSPTRSSSPNKHSRSASPSKVREAGSSPENSDSEHRGRGRPFTTEVRQPRPRRAQPIIVARSEVSPARSPLPLEIKESISSIVRSALKPHWKSNQLTAEQFSTINRDISRKIYEQVQDPAFVGNDLRQSWESLASKEVARAMADLKA
ncbi:hypothetical protein B0T18DRAFT_9747 [Schizothecium vesticola]|uniref:PHD and RING finger domain-containing protein n=1 Tax=Schizothecium vesticola TaxID=314040 RepID=A0AA40F8L8_9PEZI|nr:hypothetical protein B0T18DRAFT_9747 [Schizothecium vesticola]